MRSRNSRRRRSRKIGFDYAVLEPKQLLAGDLAALHQVEIELPTGINLVANGDFESFNGTTNGLFDADDVVGWNAADGAQINLLNYSDDYTVVIDLDTKAAVLDSVFQDIATEDDEQYVVSFDFRKHPSLNPTPTERTYDFEVLWNGDVVGEYSAADYWHTGSLLVTGAQGQDLTELRFREIGEGDQGGGDGMGPLLDNIRVVEASVVELVNGSFETTSPDRDWFYRPTDVDGWGAMTPELEDRLIKVEDATTGSDASATHGDQYLNLDTTQFTRDIVFQDLTTVAGATYYVMFDLKADGPQDNNSDELRVQWNEAWASTIYSTTNWQTYGLAVESDSSMTRLTFLEPGDGNHGEGSGVLIDNVRLYRVDPAGNNDAPEITQLEPQSANVAQSATFAVSTTTDPANQSLTYSVEAEGLMEDENTPTISDEGVISWTPSDAGPTDLTVTVTDEFGLTDEMTFTVVVGDFIPFTGNGELANIAPTYRNGIYSAPPTMTIDTTKDYQATLATTAGPIEIDLYASQAPVTVNNFVSLARDGFYDGIEFHRVLEGFMAQGGDPEQDGSGGPGYAFEDETDNGLVFDEPNLLAMANSGPDTNGSQFFMTYGTPDWLDGRHTIFGEITSGLDAFNAIVVTADSVNGAEIPRPGITKTVLQSVTITES
jgi:cyclophilin family peptidyl-prolyl cis-trans isomerase